MHCYYNPVYKEIYALDPIPVLRVRLDLRVRMERMLLPIVHSFPEAIVQMDRLILCPALLDIIVLILHYKLFVHKDISADVI
jgi:hypothetical protein